MTLTPAPVSALATPAGTWRFGRVHELLLAPSPTAWRWRVALATIEASGPFTPMPGVRRHFALVRGAGVHLEGLGPARPGDAPRVFDGAAAPHCTLEGGAPALAFNLMCREGAAGGLGWWPGASPSGVALAWQGLFALEAATLHDPTARDSPFVLPALHWCELPAGADACAWLAPADGAVTGEARTRVLHAWGLVA